jgi:lipopolysaccharide/colanic/teichoic acid biosynthesis glycosyltransferase
LKKQSIALNVTADAVMGGSPNLTLVTRSPGFSRYEKGRALKRFLDFSFAFLSVVILSPLFLLISALVVISSRGPAIYIQRRVGLDGRVFNFYKFRSMALDNDDSIHRDYCQKLVRGAWSQDSGSSFKIKEDPRVTALGKFLRKTSLDELPQLFNVLKGEMSMVGPRPPIDYEVDHYQLWHKQRMHAMPGITGLWQVSGRSSVPFDEMVLLDIHYMEHWSLLLDLKIIFRTIPVVLFGIGAY